MLVASIVLAGATGASAQESEVTAAQVDPGTQVSGAGASFPANMIEQWKADFKKDTNVTINYSAVGSGAGKTQFIAGTVDFAGSDTLASATEKTQMDAKHGSWVYIPETAGGIAMAYKLAGVSSIKLSGLTIAKIFQGDITNWNDPAITADNGSALPNKAIQVYVRSDKSGTSGVFTQYLAAVAGSAWKAGFNEQFPTNNGQIAKAGNDGVATGVQGSDGGIGYVEYSFARERKLDVASVKNGSGQFTTPLAANVSTALGEATINPDGTLKPNYEGTNPAGYPIASVTYLLAPTKMDAKKGENFKAFLNYILSGPAQAKADALGYVPLPTKVLENSKVQAAKINPAASPTPSTPSSGIQTGIVSAPAPRPAAPAPAPARVRPAATPSGAVAGAGATAAAGPQLANTGSETTGLALIGAFLLLGGAAVLVADKRRSSIG